MNEGKVEVGLSGRSESRKSVLEQLPSSGEVGFLVFWFFFFGCRRWNFESNFHFLRKFIHPHIFIFYQSEIALW